MSDWTKRTGGEMGKSVRFQKEGDDEKSVYLEEVQGIYEGFQDGVGPHKSRIYKVRSEEHGLLTVWGGLTVLDNGMADVPVGHEVLIKHLGLQKTKDGKGEFRGFDVMDRPAPFKKSGEVKKGNEAPELPPV